MLEAIIELNQFEVDHQVTKMNKLKGITEITLNLDELNNSDNLKDRRPSNYSLITRLLMKILHVLNPKPHNTRSLKRVRLFP